MEKETLKNKLIEIQKQYLYQKKEHYILKCQEEHLKIIACNLTNYFTEQDFLKKYELPCFEEEIKTDRSIAFNKFQFLKEEEYILETIQKFQEININDFLIVLGQRITSATIKNEKAIPPINKEVYDASFEIFNAQITKAVRAFEKHSERTTNNFWGKAIGNPAEKEKKVRSLLTNMLKNKTWWNVYYHYKHELVYEVRIASGHGARWKKKDLQFIGFVEPFFK
ncbi:hypothetical protein [Tenacibaculum ovolyticum]|uniref:hypothetical protein n=2 Tax=Tenacibaculum ovolyticum TaxID=104270 RepID=UPI00041E54B7|nr:hypothetical protein [Tenacibaculum ovolyticum]